ncbi:MAG: DNA-binding domain-containing protein [Thiomonas sp.]
MTVLCHAHDHGPAHAAWQAEARRQQAFIAAMFGPHATPAPSAVLGLQQSGAQWHAGLAAYRGNGLANGTAALRAQFPTILAMLGDAAFETVAARYWHGWPPCQGDLAQLGAEFAERLDAQDDLRDWPWLADSARLDWAMWQAPYAAPARFTADDLHTLANSDPAALRLHLAPGSQLLRSRWPVVTLWQLHQNPSVDDSALRSTLLAPGETAWIWRAGMQAQVLALSAAEAAWLHALQQQASLDAALDAVADDFDLAAWLQAAITQDWLGGIERLA